VNEPVFDKTERIQQLTVDHSIVPKTWCGLGTGNIDADPAFVNVDGDWHLLAGSIAHGTGPLGLDLGAMIGPAAVIRGVDGPKDWRSRVELQIGGAGIVSYRYSLQGQDGPWSQERPIDMPIILEDLQDGQTYTIFVNGRDWAGRWQQDVSTLQWTVDRRAYQLRINEVMASAGQSDWIEIAYDGPSAINLAGICLSDDPNRPRQFVFKDPTIVQPGQYVVISSSKSGLPWAIVADLGLDPDGDRIYMFDQSGQLIDMVEFGPQIPGLSCGRQQGLWRLTEPTPGSVNRPYPLGDHRLVRINEWLATSDTGPDFVELYNPNAWPVNLAGMVLTDDLAGTSHALTFPPCSFIGANEFIVLLADGKDKPGRLPFKLSSDGEVLALIDGATGKVIHSIIFGPQYTGVSEGLLPDGGTRRSFFDVPTPGLANILGF
jgi:hypothetical protein